MTSGLLVNCNVIIQFSEVPSLFLQLENELREIEASFFITSFYSELQL